MTRESEYPVASFRRSRQSGPVDVRFPVSDGLNGADVFNLFFRLGKRTD